MLVYWSDWVGVGTRANRIRPAVASLIEAAGGTYAVLDLRNTNNLGVATGRCIVGTNVTITPVLPARFMLDTATDLDVLVPNAVVNFINTQLTLTIPTGVHTWRDLFRRLFRSDGVGRWGTLRTSEPRLLFGNAGSIDVA